MKTHIIKDIKQAALLTDSFKVDLLKQFVGQARTTKQVADLMGLKAPRLYRHVHALSEGGLIHLVEERQKRGTVERYYQAVADAFVVEASIFDVGNEDANSAVKIAASVFQQAQQDFIQLLEVVGISTMEETLAPLLVKLNIRTTEAQIKALRAKLVEWVDECGEATVSHKNESEAVEYNALLSFAPIKG